MQLLILILVALVALFHAYVFVLEAFLWEQPRTRKAFGTTAVTAATTKTLATNQGVYNLFLTAGLIWSLIATNPIGFETKVFFLSCVVVAAITAGIVVSRRIMFIQGTPAVIALILVLFNR